MFEKIRKTWRQRNYRLIYSDRYGYGVEERLTPSLVKQWFINHDDYIEDPESEKMSHCPCENCVCVAICRHKTYSDLNLACHLVIRYLEYHIYAVRSRRNGRLKLVQKALKPTKWNLEYNEYGRVIVSQHTGYCDWRDVRVP